MEKELFDDLLQSLQEAKDIASGKMPPSRHFEVLPIDVKAVREQLGLSQSDFARLMQLSIKTLQTGSRNAGHQLARRLRC